MRIGIGIGIPMGRRPAAGGGGGDVTSPTLVSAVVNAAGTSLALLYSEPLDTGSVSAAARYALAGTSSTVGSTGVSGSTVTLTIAGTPIFQGETVTVTYTPGASPIQDLAGNDAGALVAQSVANNSTAQPLFIVGTMSDVGYVAGYTGSTTDWPCYALDDTNTTMQARSICSDVGRPGATGDKYIVAYRNADAQPVVWKQAGGAGAWVPTVGAVTHPSITDNHRSLKAIVDDTGRLCVWLGTHSEQEIYWEAPSPGDTSITDATLVSPRVPGGGALEALATYHDPVKLSDGAICVTWRTGGSGNGNQVCDVKRGGVWTRTNAKVFDGNGTESGYFDRFVCEPSTGAHPNRLHWSFQIRASTNAADAHGFWWMYSDDEGVTLKGGLTGTTLAAQPKQADLGPALVENIPAANTDPNYCFYFGGMGACVGLDGTLYRTAYYGPGTVSSGAYLTNGSALTIYGWSCVPGAGAGNYTKAALKTFVDFGGATVGVSLPVPVYRDGALEVYYSARYTADVAPGTGSMYCTTARGTSMALPQESALAIRNWVNDCKSATFNYDASAFACGSGPLQAFWMKVGLNSSTPSNRPLLLTLTQSATQAVDMTFADALGTLDIDIDAAFVTDDGTGKASTITEQTGNVGAITQSTQSKRATISAAGGPNGKPMLSFVRANSQRYAWTRSRVAPATTPFTVVAVVRQPTSGWSTGTRLWDINGAIIFDTGASPNLRQSHGTSSNQNAGLSTNTWGLVIETFTGSTSDELRVGRQTRSTGVSSGNTISGTTCALGSSTTDTVHATMDLARLVTRVGAAPSNDNLFNVLGVAYKQYGLTG